VSHLSQGAAKEGSAEAACARYVPRRHCRHHHHHHRPLLTFYAHSKYCLVAAELKKEAEEKKAAAAAASQDPDEEKKESKAEDAEAKDVPVPMNSKVNALMSQLAAMRAKDATNKAIVFTSVMSSFKEFEAKLVERKIKYSKVTGAMDGMRRKRELENFQNRDDVFVFLMTVRTGSVGLTLTAANYVFMLEPCLNPALYCQGIGRVHRLGQTRKVHVVNIIMKDSVEAAILKINEPKIAAMQSSAQNANAASGQNRRRMGAITADSVEMSEISQLFSSN
jgi:SNF2 family DNA or RNA helicase